MAGENQFTIARTTLLLLLVIVAALPPKSLSANDVLQIPERVSCTCPGDMLTYTCTVTGLGNTLWNGSAFDCGHIINEIILRHSQFTVSAGHGTFGECNNGAIVARSIGVTNNRYISELNVTVSANLHNRTVQCIKLYSSLRVIGKSTITVVTANDAVLEPPENVHIADIQDGQAILEWRPAVGVPTCASIAYSITSNCSTICSIITNTSARCSIPQPSMDPIVCAFSVQSMVCSSLSGRPSSPAIITFYDQAPPDPPHTLSLGDIGGTRVLLCWEPPLHLPATVLFYEIIAQAVTVNGAAATAVNVSTGDDRTCINVTGLLPGTTYKVSVVAVSEREAAVTVRSLPSIPIEFVTDHDNTEIFLSVKVQALCSVVVWYNPDVSCEYMINGYDVRFYSPQSDTKNVTRHTEANQTFYIIRDEDRLGDKHDINVQVRVIHRIPGVWSKGISLGCERPTNPPEAPSVYFELQGVVYTNNSAVSLLEVGEGESALLCKTNREGCCGTPPNRFGEFYYPNGIKVPIAKQQQGFYRNRGEKVVRLNRRGGAMSPTGKYRCEIPDANGSMQSIYITLNV